MSELKFKTEDYDDNDYEYSYSKSESDFWEDSDSEINTDYDEKEYSNLVESSRPKNKMDAVWRRVIVKKFDVVKKFIETHNSEEDIRTALNTFFFYHYNLAQKNKFHVIFDHYIKSKYIITQEDFQLYLSQAMRLICFDYIHELFNYIKVKNITLNFDSMLRMIVELGSEFSNQNEYNVIYMVLENLYQLGYYSNPNNLYEKFMEICSEENFEMIILKFCTMYFDVQTVNLHIVRKTIYLDCDYYEKDVVRIYQINKQLIEDKKITLQMLSEMFNLDFTNILELPFPKYEVEDVEIDDEEEWNRHRIVKVDYPAKQAEFLRKISQ